MVVSDDHAGLRKAIAEVRPEAVWQRCYVHFLRNALDYLPRKGDDDCLRELRWLYDRLDVNEARKDLAGWLKRWQEKYPKLCAWVEDNIEETLSFYSLPHGHHKHLKSTNMLERLNEEIKRRTRVVRIFPNDQSCLRLIEGATNNQERRDSIQEAKAAEAMRWTIARLWEPYKASKPSLKGLVTDENRFKNYIKPSFGEKAPVEIIPLDIERLKYALQKKTQTGHCSQCAGASSPHHQLWR